MKKKMPIGSQLWMFILIAAVALGFIGDYFLFRSPKHDRQSAAQTRARMQPTVPPLIRTSRLVKRAFTNQAPWIGVVESQSFVQLRTTISGQITSVETRDETPVEKGGLLFHLGGVQVESELARLRNVAKALKSQEVLAGQTVDRLQEDLKDNLVTKDQLAASRQSVIEVQSQLRIAQAALDGIQDQTRIIAPTAGVFTGRRVSVGQQVNAGDVLAEIIDPHSLRIVASLFPPQGSALEGNEAIIRLEGNDTLPGSVRRILPKAGATGAVIIWIEGPQIDQRLRPGQSISGSLMIDIRPSALAVPQSAIVYDADEQPFLFVPRDGAYERQSVRLGMVEDGWVEILSGIKEEQSVVTQGAHELFYHDFNKQFKILD